MVDQTRQCDAVCLKEVLWMRPAGGFVSLGRKIHQEVRAKAVEQRCEFSVIGVEIEPAIPETVARPASIRQERRRFLGRTADAENVEAFALEKQVDEIGTGKGVAAEDGNAQAYYFKPTSCIVWML